MVRASPGLHRDRSYADPEAPRAAKSGPSLWLQRAPLPHPSDTARRSTTREPW